jgi:hypothetical protein
MRCPTLPDPTAPTGAVAAVAVGDIALWSADAKSVPEGDVEAGALGGGVKAVSSAWTRARTDSRLTKR